MNKIKILFSFIILIYIIACFIHIDARLPGTKKTYIERPKIYGGDEEHYLIMVSSLIEDFDLELRNNYHAAQYEGSFCAGEWWQGKYVDHHSRLYNPVTKQYFYAGCLNEEDLNKFYDNGFIERPHHPPGMSFFGSIFLWPFAYSRFLESAAILLTAIISLIGFYFLYKLLLYFFGKEHKTECMKTILFFSLGTPLSFYACSFFKENYVAVFLIFAMYLLFVKKWYFLSGCFITLCFFSKYQMILICAPLILYPLFEKDIKGFFKISSAFGLGIITLLLFNYKMFGHPLEFTQPQYDPIWLKKVFISAIIATVIITVVSFIFHILSKKLNFTKLLVTLRLPIKFCGYVFFLYLLYKSSITRKIVFNMKDGLFLFSPFLIFSILELCNLQFWINKKHTVIILVLLLYTVILFHRDLAIGSAFSLRTAVSIIPLLAFPFAYWYIRKGKWFISKLIFIPFVSFSIFINILAPIARIHFWHFNIHDATKGAVIDLKRWREYKIVPLNLDILFKDNIAYNTQHHFLQPIEYNKLGTFSILIDCPAEKLKRGFLRITAYVIYKGNYVKLYLFDKNILNLKTKGREIRKSIKINVKDILNKKGKVLIEGKLFTNRDTSKELYDSRVEEILLY